MPRVVLGWLAGNGSAASGVHGVEGSLLFADISGFTRLSERLAARGRAGAEEVASLVGEVLTALIGEIEDRGGDVLVFAGDALVAFYDGPDAPRRAATTAAAIQRWFGSRGAVSTSAGRVTLRVSIGVASGPVDLVLVGGEERGLLVAGPTASELVRLERAASAGEILVDPSTAAVLEPAWVGEARDGGLLLRRAVPPEGSGVPRHDEPGVDATPFVPASLRPFLAAGPDALEAEHRLATTAFVIAGGLDARLATDRAAVTGDLDALYRAASAVAARHRLTLIGSDVAPDGVTLFLVAGAPVASGGEEEAMIRALGELLAIPEAGRLRLRAGANRGPVFAGLVGAPNRRTYTAMGDTTNLAARLAARATPGQLLVTADVLARSEAEFASEPLPAFVPRGKRDAVVPYLVGASTGRHTRTPARLPIAGRADELAVLDRALAAAARGEGGVVEIVGEPGTGKSRLVQELLPDDRIAVRLVARFTPADEGTPYGGLRQALWDLAGIAEDAEPAAAVERLVEWVVGLAPGVAPWLPLIAIPFGLAIAETPEVAGLAAAFRRERLHAAMGELLRAVLPAPAVLVLEDLHWADEASFALLGAVADAPAARSWLIIALARPGSRPFGGKGTTRLRLEGLGPDAVMGLALAAAGGSPLSDADLAAIVARAAGNPLFVRELAAVAAEGGTADGLPDRLESLLASRIDRLDGPRRALLRRAAVLGRTVDLELLGEVLTDGDDVAHDLAAWADLDEFIAWVDPTRVRFRHDLIRDAAYEGLSHARRRGIHARLAAAIERRAGTDTDEVAAVLSVNFARGGEPERAFRYARRAGDLARSRYANVDAAAQYQRALECAAGPHAPSAAEVESVAEALGDVAELAGRYDDALRGYARARALIRAAATAALTAGTGSDAAGWTALDDARLDRKTGVVCERAGRYREALGWYTRAHHRLATQLADVRASEAIRIRLELDRAGVRYRQGRYGACVRSALPAAAAAARIGERTLLAHAYYLLHAAYGDLGSPEVARYRDLALPIYEELGDLVGQGNVLNNLGIEAYFEGRWDDALALYARSKAAKTRAGDVANAATQSNNEAEILSDQGRLEEAEALFADALRVWGAAGYEIGIALATSNLGRAAARAGRYDDGLARLHDAAARFARIGAHGYVDETRARIAECLGLAGRADEAEAVARETLASVRHEAQASVLETQLERTLGWCALLRRDPDAARGHLEVSLRVGRALNAGFEVAQTLRARLALPATGGPDRADDLARRERDGREAAAILAGLGVLTLAEPVESRGPGVP